jgi:hypothetical protein
MECRKLNQGGGQSSGFARLYRAIAALRSGRAALLSQPP